MEQQERAAGKTYPGHKSSPFFFFLISLSLTHYYVFSPTKLTKYVSSRRDVKKKTRRGRLQRGRRDHFISRLLKSSMAVLSPRKLLHLQSALLGRPRLQLKQSPASRFTGFIVTMAFSSWHGAAGGLMQRSRLRSGHLSGFPWPQSPAGWWF